jgi:two-component system cell cycle sensor histidine kinase/response regulator CckA
VDTLRVLMVEDSEDDAALLEHYLRAQWPGLESRRVDTADDLRDALKSEAWDIVLSDYSLPTLTALDALRVLQEMSLDIPFLVVSGTIDEEVAVEVLRAGAMDFLSKGRWARLAPAIERERREAITRRARREAEANLRQAHKMESVGNLAGGIAHDFNNLLTVIIGYGDMLAERFAADQEASADLAEILRAARSAAVMTRQLLAFSRRQVLRPQVVDLNETISDLQTMLQRLIEANVRMAFRLAPEPTPVRVDPGQIEQVLLNLVVNARDAMPNGGDLMIETAIVRVRQADIATLPGLQPGEHVRLTVRDTGSGIPPSVRGRIFEPFFTTKEVGRGTGLGLATVYGIVQQSDGTITVESELGAGTAFTIHLPLSTVAASTKGRPVPLPDAPVQQSFVMLVVEDDPHLRTFCERVVRELSGVPLTAGSAEEAEAVCRAHRGRIDAALIDVMMPGVGGAVFGEWMRNQYPDTRLIYTSGYSPDDLSRRGMGPDDAFIGKPFTKATLLAALRATVPPVP